MEQLLLGDCMELIKQIPDKSIDLVITDPPYLFVTGGIGHGELAQRMSNRKVELNGIIEGFDFAILDELCRVLNKINIYVWCSKLQVKDLIQYFENKKCNYEIFTWHKTNPAPIINNNFLPDTEFCIYARDKGVGIYSECELRKKYWITPINKQDKDLYKHPTIKPLSIIENLVFNSSLEGQTVLDCFMGSGTTGVACKKNNRNFIGMEIDPEYYEIAKARINNQSIEFKEQLSMF